MKKDVTYICQSHPQRGPQSEETANMKLLVLHDQVWEKVKE